MHLLADDEECERPLVMATATELLIAFKADGGDGGNNYWYPHRMVPVLPCKCNCKPQKNKNRFA